MRRPHGSAIVSIGRLASGAGTETKRLFSPLSFYQASELTDSLVFDSIAAV